VVGWGVVGCLESAGLVGSHCFDRIDRLLLNHPIHPPQNKTTQEAFKEGKAAKQAKEEYEWGRGLVQKEKDAEFRKELEDIKNAPFARCVRACVRASVCWGAVGGIDLSCVCVCVYVQCVCLCLCVYIYVCV
jgi:hypothetical protein